MSGQDPNLRDTIAPLFAGPSLRTRFDTLSEEGQEAYRRHADNLLEALAQFAATPAGLRVLLDSLHLNVHEGWVNEDLLDGVASGAYTVETIHVHTKQMAEWEVPGLVVRPRKGAS